jgi:hypothetical protein
MKIEFDNENNFVEIIQNKNKITLVLSCQDIKNSLKSIINSVEITKEEWDKLISEIV